MGVLSENAQNGAEIFLNPIYEAVNEFIEENGIEAMEKEAQTKWVSCLMYVRDRVFKNSDILKREPYREIANNGMTNNNSYDQEKVNKVLDIYFNLCYFYDKEINLNGFSKMTGITPDVITGWAKRHRYPGEPTPTGFGIYEKIMRENEESLHLLSFDPRKFSACIAGLNRKHHWNSTDTNVDGVEQTKGLTVAELPDAPIKQTLKIEKQKVR